MRFTAVAALLGLLAVQQAAAVSILLSALQKSSSSNSIVDREETTRIGNAPPVFPFAQNPATSAPIRRRVVSVVPKNRNQQPALALAFREWVCKTQTTAP